MIVQRKWHLQLWGTAFFTPGYICHTYRYSRSLQTYGLGLKEVWRVPADQCKPGHIQHTFGWPMPTDVYGGSFLYHMAPDLVLVGFVVGLDYKNPYLNPYQEFQR